jgi:hypothetical protein
VSGAITVDYEELHRMSRVWAAAAVEFGRLSSAVCAIVESPAIVAGALLDPVGAMRADAAILRAALGSRGLAVLAATVATDALRLGSVVAREQVVDDLPTSQVEALAGFAMQAPWRLALRPRSALSTASDGRHEASDLVGAAIGYLAPFTEPVIAATAPPLEARVDILRRRPARVDTVFGLPIRAVGGLEREGPGAVAVSAWRPAWSGSAPASLAEAMSRVSDLERQATAELAIEAITGADGVRRYVVELPGIRDIASRRQPQDLIGAAVAMVGGDTTYARCVREALDAAQVPAGAEVMLVGHSDGGIVAMELAGDPSFNGSRVEVTHVVAAGSPISGKTVAAGRRTRVLSVENVNDVVTHLDALDSGRQPSSRGRLTYQYSDDSHDPGANHSSTGYAQQMELLATSPNPLMHDFQTSVQPYLWSQPGDTTTSVFTLTDRPG